MARTPEVLIVDQNPEVRFELKRLLKQSQFGLAGEAGFGTEAVSLAVEAKPDVIICGMDEPIARALQTVGALIDSLAETPVIIYSVSRTLEAARHAMLAGARDFLTAPTTPGQLEESIVRTLESEEHRRMRLSGQTASMGAQGTIITVFGPKGGIGKTTIATTLAIALAQESGQSVALVDADTGFGDVTGMLELKPEQTIVDLVRRIDGLSREELPRYLCRHSSGLAVLAGPTDTFAWRNVSPDQFRKVLETLARIHDVLVIDTGGMLDEVCLAALDASTLVLWVTTPEFASVKDSLHSMEALQAISFPPDRIRVTLNRVSPEDGVRPQTLEEVLRHKVFWQIPYDRRLRQESELGNPDILNHPASPAAHSVIEMARAIGGSKRAAGPPRRWGLAALFGRAKQRSSQEEIKQP
jgi:pilus assembly protein CpaE